MSIHPINTRLFLTATLGFTIGFGLPACRSIVSNPYHCQLNKGDSYCQELYGDEKSFCSAAACLTTSPDGCTATMPSKTECYYPCGGDLSVVDDDSCLEGGEETETETETSDTTETETETGPEDCVDNGDCDNPDAPFCDDLSGECVACDGVMDPDAACAEVDATVPLCIEGTCVQCTEEDDAVCGDLTPICDADANTCIGCSGHEQCPESACNIAEGNCMNLGNIVHVDGDEDCGVGDGSEGEPYCDLGEALLAVGDESLIIVHEITTDPFTYNESNTIQISVAIFAAPGESPVAEGSGGVPALAVSSAGQLFMKGLYVDDGDGVGVSVAGGQVWIEKSRIVNNSGGGIVVDGGGSLVLENSFVGGNTNDVDALVVTDGSATVIYSTLAGGAAASNALSCEAGATVDIRNSLLVSRQSEDEVVCDEAILSNNALEMDVAENTSLGEMPDTSWFVSYMSGDFSLSGAHPGAIDMAATWLDGDPATDINGDARPTTNGTLDFAGADRIP